jgi:uncharacterized membrane protein YhiD involved in acid resistance
MFLGISLPNLVAIFGHFNIALPFLPNLLMSALLGGLLGMERRRRNKVAGLRTIVVISMACCVITMTGVYSDSVGGHVDPTRMAAQILSGIGFIGAGAIFRQGFATSGVTTAASILFAAGIGIACGFSQFAMATTATVIDLLALWATSKFFSRRNVTVALPVTPEGALITEGLDIAQEYPIKFTCHPDKFAEIRGLLGDDYKLVSLVRKNDLLKVVVNTTFSAEQREALLDKMISTPIILSMETAGSEEDDQ